MPVSEKLSKWLTAQNDKSSAEIEKETLDLLKKKSDIAILPNTIDGLAALMPKDIGWSITWDGMGYCADACQIDPESPVIDVFVTDGWEYSVRLRLLHGVLSQIADPSIASDECGF